uniref:Secreted protein n=1 Tax=Schistosoma mansoni TaxID=6183 RepID=A0A5K4FA11_SCHMA
MQFLTLITVVLLVLFESHIRVFAGPSTEIADKVLAGLDDVIDAIAQIPGISQGGSQMNNSVSIET